MNDRLARIKADCLARLADDAAPEVFKKGTRDVLALVEVAKAARSVAETWADPAADPFVPQDMDALVAALEVLE